MTSTEASLRGRIGAYARLAKHGTHELSAQGNAGLMARFEREVDPEGTLPLAERMQRAEMAKRSYFAALALKSAQKRSAKARRKK